MAQLLDSTNFWIAQLKVNVKVDLNLGSKTNDDKVLHIGTPTPQSCVQRTIVCIFFPFEVAYILVYTLFIRFRSILTYFFPGKPKSLKDEIILVIGGGSGIGREICCHLAKQEKQLTIITWDVDEKNNFETLERLKHLGVQRVFAFTVDVSNKEQISSAAQNVRENIGNVTILFNNVGIKGGGEDSGSCWDQDQETIQKVFTVNAVSHCWTLREFLPKMIEIGRGHVVEMCSVLSFLPVNGSGEYVGSQFALRGYFLRLKEELRRLPRKHDICISLVYPNFSCGNRSESTSIIGLARYFFFNRALTLRSVASQIIYGMRRRKEHIYVPEGSRILHILADFFPEEVISKVLDYSGLPDLDGIQD